MKSDVTFRSGGMAIAGHLYLPEDLQPGERRPAIVTVTPWSGLKEQTAGLYARRMAEQGFVALAFDHRNYGDSEGLPRFDEDPFAKSEDIKNAVTFLAGHDAVDADRIGAIGICAGGGYVPYTAATDRRIKAVATVSGVHSLRGFLAEDARMDRETLIASLDACGKAREAYEHGEEPAYMPVFPEDAPAGSAPLLLEAPDYYLNPARGGHPNWANKTVLWSLEKVASFSALEMISLIAPHPVLFIAGTHADTAHHSQAAYAAAGEPKELYWIEGASHIDLYDRDQYVTPAVAKMTDFFRSAL
ncbi:alpha/beta hydrolase [Catellatospora paridis]|uniref:alpha/beta hydrolase n=1 Tax=Catellatospora paridis TaxID=1617086 RepID=UPI0012D392B8|nr:alpha/beta hydrolase [Catellatospora paridis]